MNRVFFSIGPITVYWYSILIMISVLIGYYFSLRESEKNGLQKKFISDLVFYLVIVAILGARIYYVIFNFDVFRDRLLDILKIWEGGLAIYGAIIFSIIFIIYYSKKKDKNSLLVLDTLTPYLILGQAIGRWGNFFNSEAHGSSTSLEYLQKLHLPKFIIKGMYINGNYYIPTFLYESIWCCIGFIVLLYIRKKDKYDHPGILLFTYFIWYGIGRFLIEGLRTDSLYFFSLRVSQIVSIILILIGLIGIIKIKKKNSN